MDIFNFKDYRDFINNWIHFKGEKGLRTQLAKAAGCSPSWLTRVLAGQVQLTPDQAYGLAIELHLNEMEVDYFLHLVELDRSATPLLKKRIIRKIEVLQKQSTLLKNSIQAEANVTEVNAVKYYSTWVFAVVHVACMIKPQQPEEVSRLLHLPISVVTKILGDLSLMGLVAADGSHYQATSKNVHLPSDHPFENQSHVMWRNRTIQFFQEGHKEGLHYSAIHCLSVEDIATIQKLLKDSILKARSLISESPSEKLAVFCLDWYSL